MEFVREFLRRWPRASGAKLCGVSYAQVRGWLVKGQKALGIPWLELRSYSFRRGAATVLFTEGVPIMNIMEMGRWASLHSCRIYIQHAEAELMTLTKNRPTHIRPPPGLGRHGAAGLCSAGSCACRRREQR